MEHIVDCLSPKRVYNKYLDEYVWVRCNRCDACKKRRASRWIARLERERMNRRFCFFVTLTYDEISLPRLVFDDSHTFLQDISRNYSVPFSELVFSSAADRQYFDARMSLGGIPYASVSDIQKFHKRLNKYFYENVSKEWQNFRYFTVSEFGSSTLRPHCHSIYFCDKQSVADSFEKAILSCWKYGRIDCQSVQRSANSYVAQYLNQLFDLPSFYSHSSLRPWFVCSKRPPIGSCCDSEEYQREIFEAGQSYQVCRRYAGDTSLSNVPLLPSVENRLFPKCKAFGKISHSLRVALYGLVARNFGFFNRKYKVVVDCYTSYVSFEFFKQNVMLLVKHKTLQNLLHSSELVQYLTLLCDGFSERGITALKRLYYLSKRVVNYCMLWKVTLEYYVRKVEDYYQQKEMNALNMFYRFQENFNLDVDELVHCYPEFAFKHQNAVLPLVDCSDFQFFRSDSEYAYKKATKTHFKNLYFDSLEYKNHPLFTILKTYLYAKKCYEVVETFG